MRPWISKGFRTSVVSAGFLFAAWAAAGRGDEPGRIGRLFRFAAPLSTTPAAEPIAEAHPVGDVPGPASPPIASTSPSPQPRLIPLLRVSRPVTDADPIVTRVSLGRSDDGNSFGMFLQVYADGTVIDSEGVHHPGREAIKEVVAALEQGDLYRLKGHCGGPSTDYVEQVQMVVFERSLGRLRANAFSFAGNTQGCDASVRRLQVALEALQSRLSRPTPGSVAAPVPAASLPATTQTAATLRLNGEGEPPAP